MDVVYFALFPEPYNLKVSILYKCYGMTPPYDILRYDKYHSVRFAEIKIRSKMLDLLYTAQLKTCCINRHVVPFCEIQAALEDMLCFQHKTHAQL